MTKPCCLRFVPLLPLFPLCMNVIVFPYLCLPPLSLSPSLSPTHVYLHENHAGVNQQRTEGKTLPTSQARAASEAAVPSTPAPATTQHEAECPESVGSVATPGADAIEDASDGLGKERSPTADKLAADGFAKEDGQATGTASSVPSSLSCGVKLFGLTEEMVLWTFCWWRFGECWFCWPLAVGSHGQHMHCMWLTIVCDCCPCLLEDGGIMQYQGCISLHV